MGAMRIIAAVGIMMGLLQGAVASDASPNAMIEKAWVASVCSNILSAGRAVTMDYDPELNVEIDRLRSLGIELMTNYFENDVSSPIDHTADPFGMAHMIAMTVTSGSADFKAGQFWSRSKSEAFDLVTKRAESVGLERFEAAQVLYTERSCRYM